MPGRAGVCLGSRKHFTAVPATAFGLVECQIRFMQALCKQGPVVGTRTREADTDGQIRRVPWAFTGVEAMRVRMRSATVRASASVCNTTQNSSPP